MPGTNSVNINTWYCVYSLITLYTVIHKNMSTCLQDINYKIIFIYYNRITYLKSCNYTNFIKKKFKFFFKLSYIYLFFEKLINKKTLSK
jgi:hypothetical protein